MTFYHQKLDSHIFFENTITKVICVESKIRVGFRIIIKPIRYLMKCQNKFIAHH
jgi:hypothetical protein